MGSRSDAVLISPALAGRLFHFVMIKPTHYDDDGYPIQWFRSAIPSNTLACLNGLAEDARRRNVLGTGSRDTTLANRVPAEHVVLISTGSGWSPPSM